MARPLVITAVEPEFLHLELLSGGAAQLVIDIARIEGAAVDDPSECVVVNLMKSDLDNIKATLFGSLTADEVNDIITQLKQG